MSSERWQEDFKAALDDCIRVANERQQLTASSRGALIKFCCRDLEDSESLTRQLRRAWATAEDATSRVITEDLFDAVDRAIFMKFLSKSRREALLESHRLAREEQDVRDRLSARKTSPRLEALMQSYSMTPRDLRTVDGFAALVFGAVYERAMRAESEAAIGNLEQIFIGFENGHDVFSHAQGDVRFHQHALLLLIGAFSLYRLGDPREIAYVQRMRLLQKKRTHDSLVHGVLAHTYFHDIHSGASSTSLGLVLNGRGGNWAGLSGNGVYFLRAADLAVEQGFAGDERPQILRGFSVAEAFDRAIVDFDRHGRTAERDISRATQLKSAVLSGDLNALREGVLEIQRDEGGDAKSTPYRRALFVALEARTTFVAAQGSDPDLLWRAGGLVRELRQFRTRFPGFRLNPIDVAFIPALEKASVDSLGTMAHMF